MGINYNGNQYGNGITVSNKNAPFGDVMLNVTGPEGKG
jgi:hypothetical protein